MGYSTSENDPSSCHSTQSILVSNLSAPPDDLMGVCVCVCVNYVSLSMKCVNVAVTLPVSLQSCFTYLGGVFALFNVLTFSRLHIILFLSSFFSFPCFSFL